MKLKLDDQVVYIEYDIYPPYLEDDLYLLHTENNEHTAKGLPKNETL